jgi:hypothetical protein
VNCPYGGTKITIGASTTYACNGAPGGGGMATFIGGIPPVTFAGYTTQTYAGNLGGRSGAHELCGAAFTGSHFCTDWEVDQATPPASPATGAWVDAGDIGTNRRYFRYSYSTSDFSTCAGWSNSAAAQQDGGNLGSGLVFTALGGISSSFVGLNDGGCENPRPLACCKGGTAVRFRGFTSATQANLGGRSGAHAMCEAAFNGSHFCTDWEVDQAAVPAPIPSTGAWVDAGNGTTNNQYPLTRYYRESYSTSDFSTCAGWTNAAAGQQDGGNLGSGLVLTALGGISSSFVGLNDGGCENPRPVACCDGYPGQ